MLNEKLELLKTYAMWSIAQDGKQAELGERLVQFCQHPNDPEFLNWCATNGARKIFVLLANAGVDLSINL